MRKLLTAVLLVTASTAHANSDLSACGVKLVKYGTPGCFAAVRNDGSMVTATGGNIKVTFVQGKCGLKGKDNYDEVLAKGKLNAEGFLAVTRQGKFVCTAERKLNHI